MLYPQIDFYELEDARIIEVDRKDGNVILLLDLYGEPMRLELYNVSKEIAEFSGDNNVTLPDPEPEFPLDFIETAKVDADSVTLSGYRRNVPWHVWRIEAASLSIKRGV